MCVYVCVCVYTYKMGQKSLDWQQLSSAKSRVTFAPCCVYIYRVVRKPLDLDAILSGAKAP